MTRRTILDFTYSSKGVPCKLGVFEAGTLRFEGARRSRPSMLLRYLRFLLGLLAIVFVGGGLLSLMIWMGY